MSETIIPILGMSLVLAFVVGKIAHRLKVPRVTGYLMVGILLGPTVFNKINLKMAEDLHFISEVALGLILFNIGGEFHTDLLKKIGWQMVRHGLLFSLFVFGITASLCLGLTSFMDMSWMERSFCATFLGVLAMASAPPTTLMVIKEYDSQGSLTDYIIVTLALTTMASILASQIVFIVFGSLGYLGEGTGLGLGGEILKLIWTFVGSIVTGTILGFILSYMEQKEKSSSEVLLAVICAIFTGMTLSHYLELDFMLISIFLGFSLVNMSHSGDQIHQHIKGVGLSIYALFFILAGAHINLRDLETAGTLGLIYVIARSTGILVGSFMSNRILKHPEQLSWALGLGLMSHAGVALGLIDKLSGDENSVNMSIQHAVVASVVFYEITGPFLLRAVLIRAAEVKVSSLLRDASSGISISVREMLRNFLVNIGWLNTSKVGDSKTISAIVSRKVYAIQTAATFAEVVKYIDDHHFPIYPVVGKNNEYEGMINFVEMKNVMFDQFLSKFVVARDLIGLRESVAEDCSLEEAAEAFRGHKVDALPVVGGEGKKLVGFLLHKDVLIALKE